MRLLMLLGFLTLVACQQQENWHRAEWSSTVSSTAGDFDFYPRQDWQQQEGQLELIKAGHNQHCVWSRIALDNSTNRFCTSVDIHLSRQPRLGDSTWAGFTFGLPENADEGVQGLAVGVTASGRLFVGKTEEFSPMELPDDFRLETRGVRQRDGKYYIFLEVFRTDDRMIGQRIVPVDPSWLTGLMALSASSSLPASVTPWEPKTDSPSLRLRPAGVQNEMEGLLLSFQNWELSGPRVEGQSSQEYE